MVAGLTGSNAPIIRECPSAGLTLDAAADWLHANRATFAAEAQRAVAVLFRGFPVRTAEDFDRFVAAFDWPNFAYEDSLSNAVRVVKTPRVFTANEAPPDIAIFLHHEMAQTPVYPGKRPCTCWRTAERRSSTS